MERKLAEGIRKRRLLGCRKAYKKAQISMFLIVGLLLLLSAFVIISIRRQGFVFRENVPPAFVPLKNFVESCLKDSARDAFINLGLHGGYIMINNRSIAGQRFSIDSFPYNSDFLQLSAGQMVPFWNHLEDKHCVNCVFTSSRPSLSNIERQAELYINEHIGECIANFSSFKSEGFNITSGMPKSRVIIGDNDVSLSLNYTIHIVKGGDKARLSRFYSKLPLNFRRIYDLASSIKEEEQERQLLARSAIWLISLYSGVSPDLLPPPYETRSDRLTIFWQFSNVKQKIRNILFNYVPLIRVNFSSSPIVIMGNDSTSEFLRFLLLNSTMKGDGLRVSSTYLNWPVYLEITPRDGELISPLITSGSFPRQLSSFTFSTTYLMFSYDLAYPVLFTIKDNSAFNGEGYLFFFALEGDVKNNFDLYEWARRFPQQVNVSALSEALNITPSDYCNRDFFVGNLTILTLDYTHRRPLEGVKISYGCGAYDKCLLGESKAASGEAVLSTMLPPCLNGYLELTKEGFNNRVIPYNSTVGEKQTLKVLLKKRVNLRLYVNKYRAVWNIADPAHPEFKLKLLTTPVPLDENDSVILQTYSADDTPSRQIININSSVSDGRLNITLSPGRYVIRGMYFNKGGLIIKKGCTKVCKKRRLRIFGCKEWALIPDNDINITPSPFGGLMLDNETRPWRVSAYALDGKSSLNISIIQMPPPPCIKELTKVMSGTKDLIKRHINLFMPKLG